MEDNTAGLIILSIIITLSVVGIGSTILSFFLDPKETRIQPTNHAHQTKAISQEYEFVTDDESASVIITEENNSPTFEFDFEYDENA